MKVILQQDIPKVGKGGDIVTVADGYARNFLFPRKYAVAATGGALKEHQARANREKERSAGLLQGAQASAAKLQDRTFTILTKVGTGTRLYGSVTSQDVADVVQNEAGVSLDKRRIALVEPIKSLGEYSIPVRLHTDVTINLKVVVTTEEEQAKKRAAEAAAAAKAEAEAAKAAEETAAAPVAEESPAAEEAPADTDSEESEDDEGSPDSSAE